MTRFARLLVTCAVAGAMLGAPALAEASSKSIWGWLDELSGPGPFEPENLGSLTFTFLTLPNDGGRPHIFVPDPNRRALFFAAEFGNWKAEPKAGFGQPALFMGHALVYVPLARLMPHSPVSTAFDAGAGLGFYRFTGDGVRRDAVNAAAIPLRLRITPARFFVRKGVLREGAKSTTRLSGITYAIGWDILPRTFTRDDFVAPRNYESSNHALFRVGFQVDVNQLLFP